MLKTEQYSEFKGGLSSRDFKKKEKFNYRIINHRQNCEVEKKMCLNVDEEPPGSIIEFIVKMRREENKRDRNIQIKRLNNVN